MSTPSIPATTPNKVVVAFLDGRRVRGFIFNFSALRDRFSLLPSASSKAQEGQNIELRQLKAIFFVKEFAGLEDRPANEPAPTPHGRKIEVVFKDGEHLTGFTEGYTPERLGFFMVPLDPTGNILRCFVINANVKQAGWA